jgi:hypothetical protein
MILSPVHTDKSWTDYTLNLSTQYDVSASCIPSGGTGGGNYVDVDLRVVVHMAANTAMVCTLFFNVICYADCFPKVTRPSHHHGSTISCPGVVRRGVAHTWSTHILTAFQRAESTGEGLIDATAVNDM